MECGDLTPKTALLPNCSLLLVKIRIKSMRLASVILVIACSGTAFAASDYKIRPGEPEAVHLAIEGVALMRRGDQAGARRLFDEAIRRDSTIWQTYYYRATSFGLDREWLSALNDINALLQLKPDLIRAKIMRASFHHALGKYQMAQNELNEILTRTDLDQEQTAFGLAARAWLEAVCPDPAYRNAKQAVIDAKRGCELIRWNSANMIDTLAAAYAETGDFESAIRYQKQALKMSTSPRGLESPQLISRQKEHLAAYQKHEPWREPNR
jgi:tetratricopeptide (TPR) repeat protein